MFKVEIISSDVSVSERGSRFQNAIAHTTLASGELRDVAVRIPLPRGVKHYVPGTYRLDDSSFYLRGGVLALYPRLVPIYSSEGSDGSRRSAHV